MLSFNNPFHSRGGDVAFNLELPAAAGGAGGTLARHGTGRITMNLRTFIMLTGIALSLVNVALLQTVFRNKAARSSKIKVQPWSATKESNFEG